MFRRFHMYALLGLSLSTGSGLVIAAPAHAAEPAVPRRMSLGDALVFARQHQPQLLAALARLAQQRTAAAVPRSQWLPTIGASAQLFAGSANNTTASYVTTGALDIPRIGGTTVARSGTWQPYASTYLGLGLNQELFDFGRIAAESAAADASADVAQQHARAAELDVTFDVEEAYFAVLAAKAVVNASADAYERSRVHRDLAQAGVTAGLRAPIELTRAEADLTRFDIGRIRAQGGLLAAQTTFAAAVGVEDGALDAAPAPAAAPDLPQLANAIARASRRDPRLRAALAQLRAAEAEADAIGAELRPNLILTGALSARAGGAPGSGIGLEARGAGFVPDVPNWSAGAVLSWPLFDRTVSAREQAARAEVQVERAELAQVRQREVAQIRLAYGSVIVARTALPGLQRAVDAALSNYAQAEARFKAGLGTSVELADAEAIRTDAEIQLALGQFELARTRAAFGRAAAEAS
jgi:outer membrane protein